MIHGVLIGKALGTVVTGVVGVAAYNGARWVAKKTPTREIAVSATALGIKGARKAEEGAENVRLTAADIVAEARGRVGEEAPPPPSHPAGHGHAH
ncbi:DUF1490 family protein [Hoyosella altamirensis]|uniref:DUF1490 family protein n=1 Tax=Hoyosella altamirensis TaxID=616997 RepID=A0A839RRG0_9ACTN|nr:hypothetical protein [Hoyosella altamirensis]